MTRTARQKGCRHGMEFASLVGEASRNVVSGTARSVIVCLILLLFATAAAVSEFIVISSLAHEAEVFRGVGANIDTYSSVDGIDAAACVALGALPGVTSSGALRRAEQDSHAVAAPGSSIPTYEVTPEFGGMLGLQNMGPGVILSDQVASLLGVEAGDDLVLDEGRSEVLGVYAYPDDGRRSGFGFALLVPTSGRSTAFDECWASSWPYSSEVPSLLRLTARSSTSSNAASPSSSQLNSSLGRSFQGNDRFTHRPTVWVNAVAAGAAFVCAIGAVRLRRVQFAAALHDGLTATSLLGIVLLESAAWVLPIGAGTPAILAIFALDESWGMQQEGLTLAVRSAASVWAGAFCGTVAGVLAIRERHLFRYVKRLS
jgi:hypothetical protein